MLGFLEYVNGNKEAALKEFEQAKKMDADFKKQFDATVGWEKAFAPILGDKEFLAKLFPSR